jgi:hypothetical protein
MVVDHERIVSDLPIVHDRDTRAPFVRDRGEERRPACPLDAKRGHRVNGRRAE